MLTLLYDSTWEGFLTAVFEAYERKIAQYRIRRAGVYVPALFEELLVVDTDTGKAMRVWKGLQQKLTHTGLDYLNCAFLSELPEAENLLLAFIQRVFSDTRNIEKDFSDAAVLRIAQVSKMVHRERHRMKAFIRFQLTKDGIYYAAIEPDFNVIPLIITHFKNRYADQQWIVYDLKRKYGIYYNLATVETITISFEQGQSDGKDITISLDESELFYRQLWQQYFTSTNIKSRKNMPLHLRHVPKRYWGLLTEKMV